MPPRRIGVELTRMIDAEVAEARTTARNLLLKRVADLRGAFAMTTAKSARSC